MSKGPQGQKRPRDPNQLGKRMVDILTGQVADQAAPNNKNAAAVEMGRKGGAARAAKLTKAKRLEIAKMAAKKRWKT